VKKPVIFGLLGLVVGPVLGFLLSCGLIALAPRGSYGEMKGVAAIDASIVFGLPIGAVIGCGTGAWLGVWLERRNRIKPRLPSAPTDEQHFRLDSGSAGSAAIQKEKLGP
jgi:hypothetical protein